MDDTGPVRPIGFAERVGMQHPHRLIDVELRYVLTDLIDRPPQRVWLVKELVHDLVSAGFELEGRPSNTVSDALRVEVRRGRVRRAGWGAYQAGDIPEATRRRIGRRARARRDRLASGSPTVPP